MLTIFDDSVVQAFPAKLRHRDEKALGYITMTELKICGGLLLAYGVLCLEF